MYQDQIRGGAALIVVQTSADSAAAAGEILSDQNAKMVRILSGEGSAV
jgi:hypothetical protein